MNEKKEIVVLIDFDNYFKKPITLYSITEFEYELKIILDTVIKSLTNNTYYNLTIRLYSGWLENATYTRKTSDTLQKIAGIDLFPLFAEENIVINGRIEIAVSLYEIPQYIFGHTYREKKGIPRIRINREVMGEICDNNKEHCPGHILSSFTRKKNRICSVDGCPTNHNELFFLREQKMVDTMIACDIITFCENNSINALFLVSDDTDHIPALITGSNKNINIKNIHLYIRNNQNEEYFANILSNFNVKTTLLL